MRIFNVLCILISLLLSATAGSFFFIMQNDWIDFSSLEQYVHGKPSILLDDEGKEWARFS